MVGTKTNKRKESKSRVLNEENSKRRNAVKAIFVLLKMCLAVKQKPNIPMKQ